MGVTPTPWMKMQSLVAFFVTALPQPGHSDTQRCRMSTTGCNAACTRCETV